MKRHIKSKVHLLFTGNNKSYYASFSTFRNMLKYFPTRRKMIDR